MGKLIQRLPEPSIHHDATPTLTGPHPMLPPPRPRHAYLDDLEALKEKYAAGQLSPIHIAEDQEAASIPQTRSEQQPTSSLQRLTEHSQALEVAALRTNQLANVHNENSSQSILVRSSSSQHQAGQSNTLPSSTVNDGPVPASHAVESVLEISSSSDPAAQDFSVGEIVTFGAGFDSNYAPDSFIPPKDSLSDHGDSPGTPKRSPDQTDLVSPSSCKRRASSVVLGEPTKERRTPKAVAMFEQAGNAPNGATRDALFVQ
ncbi:MAG: hypothetical protein Q9159_007645, partial [Coniocarpon cinnabarinum]